MGSEDPLDWSGLELRWLGLNRLSLKRSVISDIAFMNEAFVAFDRELGTTPVSIICYRSVKQESITRLVNYHSFFISF